MRRRRLAGILAGTPNLAAATGFALSYLTIGDAPKSVITALGLAADPFAVLLMAAVIVAGVLAIPQHPRMLYAEAAARPLAAAVLASYAVALTFAPTQAWITVGLAGALALEQLRRWHVIATILIPEAKAVAALMRARGED